MANNTQYLDLDIQEKTDLKFLAMLLTLMPSLRLYLKTKEFN